MRIVCPNCAASYEVPDARLIPGRTVRCARCATDWTPIASAPIPDRPPPKPAPLPRPPPPEMPSALVPLARASATPPVPRRNRTVAVAWLLTFAALGAAAWGAYVWREDVMRAWPPSERAYSALGLQLTGSARTPGGTP